MSVYQSVQKEVTICGQRFVVYKSTTISGSIRYMLMAEADAGIDWEESDDMKVKIDRYVRTVVYPSLISVTESLDSPLPTFEEFTSMPYEDYELWYETVKELNPSFFPSSSNEQQEIEKKS